MKNYPAKYRTSSLFDAFDDLFKPMFLDEQRDMKTDIKETDSGYELEIEMPGFDKEQIKVSLDDGYLTVSGAKTQTEESGGKKYLRKEISESFSRSYFIGKEIAEENVKAKYSNGILKLEVPKQKPKEISSRSITIE